MPHREPRVLNTQRYPLGGELFELFVIGSLHENIVNEFCTDELRFASRTMRKA